MQQSETTQESKPGNKGTLFASVGALASVIVASSCCLPLLPFLFAAGAATQKYMQAIQDQQEVMGAIADMVIETYAMESAVLRTQKMVQQKGEASAATAIAMTRVYLSQAMDKIESAAKKIIAAVAEGDMLRTQLAILRRLVKHEPFNTIALRQQIAQKMIERGKYTLA